MMPSVHPSWSKSAFLHVHPVPPEFKSLQTKKFSWLEFVLSPSESVISMYKPYFSSVVGKVTLPLQVSMSPLLLAFMVPRDVTLPKR